MVMLLVVGMASQVRAHDAARYTFGGAAEQGIFVLDTESGRVWRYDRIDDAWYLYDLEALVRTPRGELRGRNLSDDDESRREEPPRDE
jgi:hypothetical protein